MKSELKKDKFNERSFWQTEIERTDEIGNKRRESYGRKGEELLFVCSSYVIKAP